MPVHHSLTDKVKADIYKIQASECCICKKTMKSPKSWKKKIREPPYSRDNQPPIPYNLATFEHVVPLKNGGGRGLGNVLLACRKCNCDKGNDMPSKDDIAYLREVNVQLKDLGYTVNKIIDKNVAMTFKWLIEEMGYGKNGRK